jgi:hypothetical protein
MTSLGGVPVRSMIRSPLASSRITRLVWTSTSRPFTTDVLLDRITSASPSHNACDVTATSG